MCLLHDRKYFSLLVIVLMVCSCFGTPQQNTTGIHHLGRVSEQDGPALVETPQTPRYQTAEQSNTMDAVETAPENPPAPEGPESADTSDKSVPADNDEPAPPVDNNDSAPAAGNDGSATPADTAQNEPAEPAIVSVLDRLYNEALAFYRDEAYTQAVAAFIKVLDHDPSFTPAIVCLAKSYYKLRDFKKARRWFGKAIETDPDYSEPYIYLGEIAQQQKEYQQAIDIYIKLLGKDPENPEALLGLGSVYNTVNMPGESITFMDSAISQLVEKNSPDTMRAYYIQGMNYYRMRDYRIAYSYLSAIEEYYMRDPGLTAALSDIRRRLQSSDN
ncbi:MAG: tetratricopeptide repeat protein [Spirochaetales bacterium]|nr:tetratricopeptide repeat protein [Spirochaetales bacterium]